MRVKGGATCHKCGGKQYCTSQSPTSAERFATRMYCMTCGKRAKGRKNLDKRAFYDRKLPDRDFYPYSMPGGG